MCASMFAECITSLMSLRNMFLRCYCRENNKKWKAPKVPSPRHELAPYWEGLDDECARAFRYWYRASSNPLYFDLTCPKGQIDRVTGTIPSIQLQAVGYAPNMAMLLCRYL
jgi:hypothetical protein